MKIKFSGRAAATIFALLSAVAVCIFYYTYDPASGGAPKCLFRMLSGYDCPGCGSQRALHAFLHGRIAEAWKMNAFLFFAVPAGSLYLIVETYSERFPRLHRILLHPIAPTAIALIIIAWWILRNIL